MKMFQKAPLALAVTALMVAPVAFAENGDDNGGSGFNASSGIESSFMNEIEVDLSHKSYTRKDFDVDVRVNDRAANYSGATVDSKQFTADNAVKNKASENNATVGSGTGVNATGNVGINVAAGDNNAQANDAALASSDAMDVFGQSAIYSAQHASGNAVKNVGSPNNALLGSGSLQGASGNIAVNIAAGTSNAQQNSLAASSNDSSGHTRATVGGVQQTTGNSTTNKGLTQEFTNTVAVNMSGDVDASGLQMDQNGDVYLDTWDGNSHSGGSQTGHVDVDDQVQGAQDPNDDGGGLLFGAAGDMTLESTMSGSVVSTNTVYINNENNATIGSNALQGASGNVGVNVASGTNNLQRNSLSIASSVQGNTPQ